MSIYDTLNKEQREACCHTQGPVLILAGAGSGKTRVITHRIAYLMEECGVNPWNILAITFTNKAAGEMRERVDHLIGFGSESIWISTFHSMCVRILRRHIDAMGMDPGFTIYDSDDQKTLIRQICRRMNIDTKQLKERTIIGAISQAKNELIPAFRYQELHGTSNFLEQRIGEVYAEYEKELRSNNALDFDDLLMKTVELFQAREDVLRSYQERFRYICVDEYQDTNKAQFEIVRLLAAGSRNLCVVGDDDQSIYKFRGADIRNILDFEKVYPDAYVVRLEQNYRSTQNILDAANAVIAHNYSRKDKRLWTDQGEGSRIHFREFAGGNDEASFIAADIKRNLRENRHLSYKDFAILYRTNAQSRLLEDRLVLESIPYNIVGGHNFYDRMEIRDILGYLRTIDNGRDDISTQRILNVPKRGIGKTTIDKATAIAHDNGISLFSVLERAEEFPELARARAKVKIFTDLIQELRSYAQGHSVADLIKKIVDESEYEDYLEDYDEETAEDRSENIGELVSKAAAYEEEAEIHEDSDGPSLSGFLEEVSLVAEIDQLGENDDRVLLMTLHSAKGLEFPHVYLAGMEDGMFPSYQSIQSDDPGTMEEERRLAYVGITRAKDDLTITSARSRMINGEFKYNAVSRFVMEIPEKLLDENPRRGGFSSWDEDDDNEDFTEYNSYYGSRNARTSYSLKGDAAQNRGSVSRDSVSRGSASRGSDSRNSVSRGANSGGGQYQGQAGYVGTNPGFGKTWDPAAFRNGTGKNPGGRSALGVTGTSGVAARTVDSRTDSRTNPGTGRSLARSSDGRLRATYVKPHTSSEKKPYLTGKTGLDSLHKGAPTAGKPDYSVGDRVEHIKYGQGTVQSMEETPRDYKVSVAFDSGETRTMYAAFAKMRTLKDANTQR